MLIQGLLFEEEMSKGKNDIFLMRLQISMFLVNPDISKSVAWSSTLITLRSFFRILCSIKIKFDQLLAQLFNSLFNPKSRLETSSRLFYNFGKKKTVWRDLLIFRWCLLFLSSGLRYKIFSIWRMEWLSHEIRKS